jgi:serine O-acetyltransferase
MQQASLNSPSPAAADGSAVIDAIWQAVQGQALDLIRTEPALATLVGRRVIAHARFEAALSALVVEILATPFLPASLLSPLMERIVADDHGIAHAAALDLRAVVERDPAVDGMLRPFLLYPGFHALQIHRAANHLWLGGRRDMARLFQSIASQRFSIDIHPLAKIGRGIFIDHGVGVVIGETAVLESNVSILQEVTLGGSGRTAQRRHPHIREGVLLAAGAILLGPIEVGAASKVGAGSLVTNSVPSRRTIVGVPGTLVGATAGEAPAFTLDHALPD